MAYHRADGDAQRHGRLVLQRLGQPESTLVQLLLGIRLEQQQDQPLKLAAETGHALPALRQPLDQGAQRRQLLGRVLGAGYQHHPVLSGQQIKPHLPCAHKQLRTLHFRHNAPDDLRQKLIPDQPA